jgi:hypothetical protein
MTSAITIVDANQPREWWLWHCAHTHNNYRLDRKVIAPIDYRFSISGRDQKRRIARGQVDAKLWLCDFMSIRHTALWPYQCGAMAFWREIGTHPGEEPRMLTPPLFHFATVTIALDRCVRLLVQPEARRQRRPLSGVYVIDSANRQGEPMLTITPYENLDGRDADVDSTAQVALDAFLETGDADPRFVMERWIQITCDRCGETANSTIPDLTFAEFRKELGQAFAVRDKRDLCKGCDDAVKNGARP